MPINLPDSLYSGGTERFNTQSTVNLYAQLMARKQAKQDSLDQYYQNLHKSINPAGMRTQDINGGFTKKIDDSRKFYFQNREAIRKQQTPEQRALASQYESMHQDLLMDINKSKEAAAQEMELAKQKISGKWNPTDDDLKIVTSLSNSIYSDAYYKDSGVNTKPYTINDISLNVPQFDPKQWEEFYKASTFGLTAGKTYDEKNLRRDKTTGNVFIPFEQSYSAEQLKTSGDRAGNIFEGSRPAKVHYEHLMHDPAFLIPANEAYQSVYGAKEMVDTPKKAAQAAIIMAAQSERNKGEELRKDEDLAFQRQIQMEDIRQKNRERNLKLSSDYVLARQTYRQNKNAKVIDDYVESQYNDPDAKDGYVTYNGVRYNGKFVKAPKQLTDKFSINEGTKDEPKWNDPLWLLTSDRKNIVPVYKTGKKSKSGDSFVTPDTKPLSIADYKVILSNDWLKSTRTANEIATEFDDSDEDNDYGDVNSGSSTTIIKSSDKSSGQPKQYTKDGKTYTYEQVEKKAKESNMTVDEYSKKAGLK